MFYQMKKKILTWKTRKLLSECESFALKEYQSEIKPATNPYDKVHCIYCIAVLFKPDQFIFNNNTKYNLSSSTERIHYQVIQIKLILFGS